MCRMTSECAGLRQVQVTLTLNDHHALAANGKDCACLGRKALPCYLLNTQDFCSIRISKKELDPLKIMNPFKISRG